MPASVASVNPAPYVVVNTIGPGSDAPDEKRVRSQADCPADMVFIPESDFSYEAPLPDKKDPTPRLQRFHLKAFCIDRSEPHNGLWRKLDDRCGQQPTACLPHSIAPLSCVTPEQAECFCEIHPTGVKKRLPTDPEWLYAALGNDGRKYPWGNDVTPAAASTEKFCAIHGFQPSTRYRNEDALWQCIPFQNTADTSPFGVIGMGTNGKEMTATCVKLETEPNAPSCLVRYAALDTETEPVGQPLAATLWYVSANADPLRRVNRFTSFRCATSERAQR